MAIIESLTTHNKIYLQSCHVFGRHETKADTRLTQWDVSRLHASIRWEEGCWFIVDHSRNGTFLDDVRLPERKNVELKNSMTICFGGSPDARWRIIDLSPPVPVLISVGEESPAIPLKQFNAFPCKEKPEIFIYATDDGRWKYKKNRHVGFLRGGDIVEFDSVKWRLHIPHFSSSTPDGIAGFVTSAVPDHSPEFIFHVSLDEEHVSIKVRDGSKAISIGERAHHYLFLVLARQRLEDFSNGVEASSQGWFDMHLLSKMLQLRQPHLNIQIFRARQQMTTTFPHASWLINIIERRTGEIRFGIPNFKIYHGSALEGACQSDAEFYR